MSPHALINHLFTHLFNDLTGSTIPQHALSNLHMISRCAVHDEQDAMLDIYIQMLGGPTSLYSGRQGTTSRNFVLVKDTRGRDFDSGAALVLLETFWFFRICSWCSWCLWSVRRKGTQLSIGSGFSVREAISIPTFQLSSTHYIASYPILSGVTLYRYSLLSKMQRDIYQQTNKYPSGRLRDLRRRFASNLHTSLLCILTPNLKQKRRVKIVPNLWNGQRS